MRYQIILEMGRSLAPFPEEEKVEHNLVYGCQSTMYLSVQVQEKKLRLRAHSEALISSGLAALLLHCYEGEAPDTLFKFPPTFLSELNIHASLSPGRSNGLSALYLHLQKEVLRLIKNHF